MKSLGAIIEYYRKKRGISQRELASKTGISNAQVSRLEKGYRESPSVPTLYAIAEALEIPYNELLEAAGWKKFDFSSKKLSLQEKGHIIAICHSCRKKCAELYLHDDLEMKMYCDSCNKPCSIYPITMKIEDEEQRF